MVRCRMHRCHMVRLIQWALVNHLHAITIISILGATVSDERKEEAIDGVL